MCVVNDDVYLPGPWDDEAILRNDEKVLSTLLVPLPHCETKRLVTIRQCSLLDTSPEEGYDSLTRLGARLFGVPICLISLIDFERQWFKSRVGLPVSQTHRNDAFCSFTILEETSRVMVVPDAYKDRRFANNPLVTSFPFIRFYAGASIILDGIKIGTFCIIDTKPRDGLTSKEFSLLMDIVNILSQLIFERRQNVLEQNFQLRKMNFQMFSILRFPLSILENRIFSCIEIFNEIKNNSIQNKFNFLNEKLFQNLINFQKSFESYEILLTMIMTLFKELIQFNNFDNFIQLNYFQFNFFENFLKNYFILFFNKNLIKIENFINSSQMKNIVIYENILLFYFIIIFQLILLQKNFLFQNFQINFFLLNKNLLNKNSKNLKISNLLKNISHKENKINYYESELNCVVRFSEHRHNKNHSNPVSLQTLISDQENDTPWKMLIQLLQFVNGKITMDVSHDHYPIGVEQHNHTGGPEDVNNSKLSFLDSPVFDSTTRKTNLSGRTGKFQTEEDIKLTKILSKKHDEDLKNDEEDGDMMKTENLSDDDEDSLADSEDSFYSGPHKKKQNNHTNQLIWHEIRLTLPCLLLEDKKLSIDGGISSQESSLNSVKILCEQSNHHNRRQCKQRTISMEKIDDTPKTKGQVSTSSIWSLLTSLARQTTKSINQIHPTDD